MPKPGMIETRPFIRVIWKDIRLPTSNPDMSWTEVCCVVFVQSDSEHTQTGIHLSDDYRNPIADPEYTGDNCNFGEWSSIWALTIWMPTKGTWQEGLMPPRPRPGSTIDEYSRPVSNVIDRIALPRLFTDISQRGGLETFDHPPLDLLRRERVLNVIRWLTLHHFSFRRTKTSSNSELGGFCWVPIERIIFPRQLHHRVIMCSSCPKSNIHYLFPNF